MRIRHATRDDAPALAAMAATAFRDTYRDISEADEIEDYVSRHFNLPAVAAQLGDPGAPVLLVVDGEAIHGYAMLRRTAAPECVTGPSPIQLARIYLAQSAIGRGIGTRLLRAVDTEAHRLGAETLWLSVYDRNVRAVQFYEKHGFLLAGGMNFEFGGQIYVDPVYARPVRVDAAQQADRDAIDSLVHEFFAAFTNVGRAAADVRRVYELLIDGAVIVKAMGEKPETYSVRAFVEPREALLAGGTLVDFEERELAGHTILAGNVAQRMSTYRKTGVLDGARFDTTGIKTFQFVRMPEGWRISAVAWDDDAH